MNGYGVWRFRLSRFLGRFATRAAATLTFGRMPPFVSTSALVVREGCLLVVVDSIRKEPVLPGGHLRWSEMPQDALIREVWEETGYTVEPQGLVDVLAGTQWAGEPGVVRVIYRAIATGGSLQSSPEGEARWLRLDDMATSDTRDSAIVRRWLEAASDPEPPTGSVAHSPRT